MLAAAFEPEVKTQHLRIPRRERRERGLDLVVEESGSSLFLGVGHLVGDEALDRERSPSGSIVRRDGTSRC